jgi:hypothetical protein
MEQATDQPAGQFDLLVAQQPRQRTAQFGDRRVHLGEDQLVGFDESATGQLHPLDEVTGVALSDHVGTTGTLQLLRSEGPQGLQQHVPASRHPHDQ